MLFRSGVFAASIVGVLIYTGIMKMSRKYVSKITSAMLSLIAAGMAAQAANFLSMSGTITSFQEQLWNSSWFIAQESLLGRILNVLVGYIENPTTIELMFYFTTLVLIALLSYLVTNKFNSKRI